MKKEVVMNFLTSFVSVAIMVALAVPGFVLRKRKMLPEKAVATLVIVLIYVSQPFLTISSFLSKDYEKELLINMLITFGFSIAFHLVAYFLSELAFLPFSKRKRKNETDEEYAVRNEKYLAGSRMGVVTSFMGNIGFMGMPVMRALFPEHPEMLIYTAVFMIGFHIASWTLGVYKITKDKRNISLKSAFLNPPVFALVVAIPLFFLKHYIPETILTPLSDGVGYLADMTLPLSMIIIGMRLAEIPIKDLLSDVRAYVVCVVKLVIAPMVSLGIMLLIRLVFSSLDEMVIITSFIVMAMPSAASTLTFAEKFGGDRETAVRATLITTVLSVLSIPLLMLLCAVI